MTTELRPFVRDALGRGIGREQIRDALTRAGWQPEEIEAALGEWAEVDFPVPVPRRRPYLSAREAFLYLVLFATLYVTAFNVGSTLFGLIDWRWPDLVRHGADKTRVAFQVRSATAALVIAFPIFLFVSRLVGRAVARDPEKRHSRIRKWLTYLTLFIASLVLIGDLIALVTAVLSGELAPRFLLKTLVVFGIAGIVFGHYLGDLRHEEDEPQKRPRLATALARMGATLTVLVAIAGLVFAGSPKRERLRQLDARRIGDLQAIANAVDGYAHDHRRLPASLTELQQSRRAAVNAIVDPETAAPYAYRALDSLRYELCATFDRPDSTGGAETEFQGSRFWRHGTGRTCFSLVVPPEPRVGPR